MEAKRGNGGAAPAHSTHTGASNGDAVTGSHMRGERTTQKT